jgi:hypothetical protein
MWQGRKDGEEMGVGSWQIGREISDFAFFL